MPTRQARPVPAGPDDRLGRVVGSTNVRSSHIAEQAIPSAIIPDRRLAELGGARTPARRTDAQGRTSGRRVRHLPSGGRPFTDKQIELVTNFAAQAVIAIENTRLLSELRESLEQQTATSEVLKSSVRSPGELEPVFDSMLANATRICEAKFGTLLLCEGEDFAPSRCTAGAPALPRQGSASRSSGRRRTCPRRAANKQAHACRRPARRAGLHERDPLSSPWSKLAGARTPRRADAQGRRAVGAIVIYRQEVRPFSDKQIELVQELRRAGGDRHRERAAAQRAAGNRWSSRPRPRRC